MFGLTPQGFVVKRLADIKEEMEQSYRDAFGAGIQLHAKSTFGRIIGITSAAVSETWEAAAALYAAFNPNTATGVALANLAQVRGLEGRLPATKSTAVLVASGDANINVPAGTQFKQKSTGAVFVSIQDVNLGPGGEEFIEVRALDYGPVEAPGNVNPDFATITKIAMPVAGLDSVYNPRDAQVGRAEETDAELRLRMFEDLLVLGTGAVDAIRARLREIENVTDVAVIENASDTTDSEGRPPHSFEVIVDGAFDDQTVGDLIWKMKPAGISSVNSTPVIDAGMDLTVMVEDAEGIEQPVKFGTPVIIDIEMAIATVPVIAWTLESKAELQSAISNEAQRIQRIGADVIQYRYLCLVIHQLAVMGFSDLTEIRVGIGEFGDGTSPWDVNNIPITNTQRAYLGANRIEVE